MLPNTQCPKGHIGRQTDRSTQPRGSSLCRSVVPAIGLATLQWALWSEMTLRPTLTFPASPKTAARRNGVSTCRDVKVRPAREVKARKG
jgi:hypothetical protein